MKYAHYDENTKHLIGWYSDDVHDVIPEPNIKVSDEEWKHALKIGATALDASNKLIAADVRTEDEKKAKIIDDAKRYLTSTDWYFARKLETGEEIPTDIIEKRKAARLLIA